MDKQKHPPKSYHDHLHLFHQDSKRKITYLHINKYRSTTISHNLLPFNEKPTKDELNYISRCTQLDRQRVLRWFQNKRGRIRKKMRELMHEENENQERNGNENGGRELDVLVSPVSSHSQDVFVGTGGVPDSGLVVKEAEVPGCTSDEHLSIMMDLEDAIFLSSILTDGDDLITNDFDE